MVRPRPVPPLALGAVPPAAAACAPREKGSKMRSMSCCGDAGAGVFDLEDGHLAQVAGAKAHAPACVNLTALPKHVDEDLRQPPFVGPHQRGRVGHVVLEAQALAQRLQLEHLHDLLQRLAQPQGLGVQRELAAFDARDVQRAFDQAQQVFATAADHAHGLPAVRRHGRVFVQQLGVAQDAVQRRAQFVADGGDVACLGLVGGIGRLLGTLQGFVGAAVAVDLLDQRFGLAVGLFLRHAAAGLRQHQPPADHRAHQQQRAIGLDEGAAQGRRHSSSGIAQLAQFGLVQHQQQGPQRRRHGRHQQQVAAQAGVQLRPPVARQQLLQQGVELRLRTRVGGFAQVVAACIQRTAQRTDRPAVGRAACHVLAFVAALADHAAAGP
jgi:hypothetical protein